MDEIEKFMNSQSMNNKGKLKQSKGDYKPCQLASKARQLLGEMEYLVKFQRLKMLYKKEKIGTTIEGRHAEGTSVIWYKVSCRRF